MNRLSRLLVLSRFARQKRRLLLLFLAIAAASSLVVWIVGGYQNLFSEVIHTNSRPFGKYDLKLGSGINGSGGMRGMKGRGGPAFGGPLAKRPSTPAGNGNPPRMESNSSFGEEHSVPGKRFDPLKSARIRDGSILLDRLPKNLPIHIRKRLARADADKNGVICRIEEETLYDEPFISKEESESTPPLPGHRGGPGTLGTRPVSIPDTLIDELEKDPDIRTLDLMKTAHGFVFSNKNRVGSTITEIQEISDGGSDTSFEETVPEEIDPELHRKALNAYRACMGTPMSLGETFIGTDAVEPPADLEKGRWFSSGETPVWETVLGPQSAKRLNAEPGDQILILTKTNEYQLTVVGILDDRGLNSFYIPIETADIIAETPSETDSAGITLVSPEKESAFKARWEKRLAQTVPGLTLTTSAEFIKAEEERIRAASTFRMQAAVGTILAIIASMLIILTALTIGIEERRREIGLIRAIGISRFQIARSIFTESFLLAIPGWIGGLGAGWLILTLLSGKWFSLNNTMIGFSFLCTVIGSIAAAVVPILNACRVHPLEAVSAAREIPFERFSPRKRKMVQMTLFLFGVILISSDLILIYGIKTNTAERAAIHSGLGIVMLAFGVLLLIPTLIRIAEKIFLPILAFLFRFDAAASATELSRHIRRTAAAAAMMAIGGGLFVLMQIWGYSMLGPFLPNEQMPDAFAAFLPKELTAENEMKVRSIPHIKPDQFEPVAVEQAAFAPDSIPNGRGGEFANVVLFGMNVNRAFAGPKPFVTLKFLEGDPETALEAMKNGRGVVVNDALTIDYGFKLGDTLRLCDPKQNARILEYPIVGIVSFNGWQWLSKTGGVRRNYGRSGGILFTSDTLVRSDYHLTDTAYFWFNLDKGIDYKELETALDKIARKNLADRDSDPADKTASYNTRERESIVGSKNGNAAYVKLSTRQSLRESISQRADGVIWGLSTMPLVTLALMSIALAAVTVNSVQTRRRSFGILRSIGVERSKLARMILAESILLALIAAAASLLFGLPAAAGALKLGQSMFGTADPEIILPSGLLIGLGFMICLAVAAAVIPALQIGTAKPLDLLQEGRE